MQSVPSQTQTTAANLVKALQGHGITNVIITEEGWPSCAGNWKTQFPTNIDEEIDYFTTWGKHENQVYDSYYFMAYDTRLLVKTFGAPSYSLSEAL
jgi:exo-beta-1,3-glucanase (GH17 family)